MGQPQSVANIIDGAPDLICEQEAPGNEPWTGYLDVELAEWRNLVEWGGQSVPVASAPVGEPEKIVVIYDPHLPIAG